MQTFTEETLLQATKQDLFIQTKSQTLVVLSEKRYKLLLTNHLASQLRPHWPEILERIEKHGKQ